MKSRLAHFDQTGAAHMVDISEKESTTRVAIGKSKVRMSPLTIKLIKDQKSKKGDILGVARVAGVMAAKKTSEIIPLCHPLPLSKVSIEFQIKPALNQIQIKATVKTVANTGVEMEALTAATVSALTIYDMLKSVDKEIKITDVHLFFKEGGKSGKFKSTSSS